MRFASFYHVLPLRLRFFEVWKCNKKPSKAGPEETRLPYASQAALEEKAADLYTNAVEHYRHQRFSEAPRHAIYINMHML